MVRNRGVLSSALGLASVFWLAGALAGVATLCAWRLRRTYAAPC